MISGFLDVSLTPDKPILSIFGGTRILQLIQDKSDFFQTHIIFININLVQIDNFKNRKERRRKNPDVPPNRLLNTLDTGLIYSGKHKMKIW